MFDVYQSLPGTDQKLSAETLKLLQDDWAGEERRLGLSVWLDDLREWLTYGSGMFRGYASLNTHDQAVFDSVTNAGNNLSAQIKRLKTLY